ncbi:MAG: hypothetical protein ACJ8AH_27700 [Stellaceae bacterium]
MTSVSFQTARIILSAVEDLGKWRVRTVEAEFRLHGIGRHEVCHARD